MGGSRFPRGKSTLSAEASATERALCRTSQITLLLKWSEASPDQFVEAVVHIPSGKGSLPAHPPFRELHRHRAEDS